MSKRPYQEQDGIIVGNIEKKDQLTNPIARRLVEGFDSSLLELIVRAKPVSVHEVGCGEGRLLEQIVELFEIEARGTDLGVDVIAKNITRDNAKIHYEPKSIYDLDKTDTADLVICCEVLEHVDEPERAISRLRSLKARQYILSVPREPIWRALNMVRGKYLQHLGNTPGHVNHWSKRSFLAFLKQSGFSIQEIRAPLPWTMVLCAIETH